MSRISIFRLLFVALLLGTAAACTKSPTGPTEPVKRHDSIPWN
ncbi:MAG: hypothetical protein ACYC7F_04480 [Gemmatimonadaceae bacterium]